MNYSQSIKAVEDVIKPAIMQIAADYHNNARNALGVVASLSGQKPSYGMAR